MQAVYVNGNEAIPAGSIIEGHVHHARDARPIRGTSELLLAPDLLVLPQGQQYTISAAITQTDPLTQTTTDSEGMIRAQRMPDKDYVKRSGTATAFSAITGAAIAGGRGALWGGALGAVATGGWWFLRHKHAELHAGSELVIRLDRDVTLAPANAPVPANSQAASVSTHSPTPTSEQ
jgi:outer membrane lipoprotein SlyB